VPRPSKPDGEPAAGPGGEAIAAHPAAKGDWPAVAAAGVLLGGVFAWAYWPTLLSLVDAWNTEPDYSHGYFVVPLAIYFLWARRDRFPGVTGRLAWPGLLLIALSMAARMAGALWFISPVDGWSILLWVAGVVWLLGGWRVLWWSAPSVAFLWFMIPLPFQLERGLSLPLQRIASQMSSWVLQFLGQPAFAEGTIIRLGDQEPLNIERACSGLRIFMGIVALAFAYVIITRREWWEKALLLASVLPIALIANSSRIVITGLLYQYVSGEAGRQFAHNSAGWVMIPFAAVLFGLVLLYLDRLMREVELVDVGAAVRRERG
jgi:exosortase